MSLLLPLVSLGILFLLFRDKTVDWRDSALRAATIWGAVIVAVTEVLSAIQRLTFSWLVTAWLLINIVLIALYVSSFLSNSKTLRNKKVLNLVEFQRKHFFLAALLYCISFIIITIGFIAFVAPPNTWDSMTYHMSRVAHWIQNHSVAHYPTSFPPQLYHPPFAEFVITHFQILSDSDWFANFVQWLSMVGSIIGTSLITKQLGGDLRGQILAAVVCTTIPMGILQGSSTQNDYVVAFWVICFVYYVLRLLEEVTLNNSFYIGLSLGLAIFTKTTASIFAFPFLVWFFYQGIKELKWGFWKPIAVVVLAVNTLVISHYIRNFKLSGSLLGAPSEFVQEYKAEVFGVRILISNVVKNLSLHIATPIPSINRWTESIIRQFHTILGVDINASHSSSSGVAGFDFWVSSLINQEDMAGNFLHFVLIISIIFLCLTRHRLRERSQLIGLLLATISGFFLFCFLLKFQQWNSRHHLIVFLLFAPISGVILSEFFTRKLASVTVVLLIIGSLPWLFFNESRPLIANSQMFQSNKIENLFNTSRTEQMFFNRRNLEEPYKKAIGFLISQKCSNLGFLESYQGVVNNNLWEYPFWALLKEQSDRNLPN